MAEVVSAPSPFLKPGGNVATEPIARQHYIRNHRADFAENGMLPALYGGPPEVALARSRAAGLQVCHSSMRRCGDARINIQPPLERLLRRWLNDLLESSRGGSSDFELILALRCLPGFGSTSEAGACFDRFYWSFFIINFEREGNLLSALRPGRRRA